MRALLTLLTVALAAGCVTAAPNPSPNGAPAAPASGAEATATSTAPLALATGPLAPQTKGPVSIQALTRFKTVHVGPDGAELDVLVRLKGDGAVPAERAPMDLVIVLDRSGSMRGDKLVAVKSAALKLLDRLGKDDRVTLISYSDDVTVDALGGPTGPSGRALRDALMRVSAGGSTALGPALFKAIEQLERGDRGEARMAHVMLLSDGLANQGEQRPEVIGARAAGGFRVGVSVSTLGVGLDYNEDLMTRVADQGGGRYHFIKDSEAVAAVLNDEMNGLVATVARGVELELKGVQVIKAFGYPSDVVDGVTKVRVGALGAGQVREVVLRVKVPAGVAPSVALGELAVNFRDATAAGAPGR
ncbi:MAG: VWA domain-containing protein, partial [Myxococcales bacterium]|nr:VWA domain-containing protein [Myxococcales bacterium]